MTVTPKTGVSFIGVLFLALGAYKFLTGGSWVVWVILGVLFGGLGLFGRKSAAGQADDKGGQ